MPSTRWLNTWWTGYQRMRLRTTQTRKDKCSTGQDCFFGSLNRKASHSVIDRISIESGLTGAELATPLHRSVKLGMVLRKLIYGLNTAMFESRRELPGLTTGNEARGALTGVPQNGTGHRIPCDKFSRQRTLRALQRDVSAR